MKTSIYIDGFNLYYGAVKDTPYKWLDVGRLCQNLLPKNQIHRIRYFTALLHSRPDNPAKGARQQIYLRALQTIPNLTIHFGSFLSGSARMTLRNPPPHGPRTVEVIRTQEKGSDVNLATYMLLDGFNKDYEMAVVISNDSDLCLPISVVRNELGFPVGLLNPHPRPSRELMPLASFYKPIRKGALAASQFPPTLADAQGTITKPKGW